MICYFVGTRLRVAILTLFSVFGNVTQGLSSYGTEISNIHFTNQLGLFLRDKLGFFLEFQTRFYLDTHNK